MRWNLTGATETEEEMPHNLIHVRVDSNHLWTEPGMQSKEEEVKQVLTTKRIERCKERIYSI
jgi:hypothetical protein